MKRLIVSAAMMAAFAAFGDEFLVMRCCGYAFFDPETPVPTREMKRLAFPGQGELCADIPDDSAPTHEDRVSMVKL